MTNKNIFDILNEYRGGTFFKHIEISDKYVKVYFYKDYSEYKNSEDSNIDIHLYNSYWKTGKQVEKMISEPIRLLRDYNEIEVIDFEFGVGDNVYNIHIDRKDFEEYTNTDFDNLKDNDEWINFVDTYIYKLNNPKRTSLFERYVKITKM